MSELAVVIVSWNVRDLLRGCLASLPPFLFEGGQVHVIDSASSDGSADMLRAEFPQARLRALNDNLGYVKSNNLALRQLLAQPEKPNFIWLLNPDTIVHEGCVEALWAHMKCAPRCALCGPQLLNPNGTLQHGAFHFPGLMQLLIDTQPRLARLRNTRWDGRYGAAQYASGAPFKIGFPLGAGMFARREAIEHVGLLDEGFEMYCEEVDWARRMANAGWQRYCVPAARLTHFGGASAAQASERAKRLLWQSRRRYYAKHYSRLKLWLAENIVRQAQ